MEKELIQVNKPDIFRKKLILSVCRLEQEALAMQ